jgi:DNA-binding winged helix-turn-helix (wHTH) protein
MAFEIWILEKPHSLWLTTELIGDFPIRAFASFDALWVFYSIRPNPSLRAFIINRTQFSSDVILALQRTLKDHSRKIPIFGVFKDHFTINGDLKFEHGFSLQIFKESIRQWVELPFGDNKVEKSSSLNQSSGRYQLDFERLTILDFQTNTSVLLTLKELKILSLFFHALDKKATRGEILRSIWIDTHVGPRTLDSHISRLRKKIEILGINIESNYRDGYTLVTESPELGSSI